jgi:hypothetical protein
MVEIIQGGRFGCVYADCRERFDSVGDKKRHIRTIHPDDSPCASGCKPSQGDVCGGPRCT